MLHKSEPKSLHKSFSKNQNTQKGHKGTRFLITQNPDIVIDHIPSHCKGCELFGSYTSCGNKNKHYEVDIVIEAKVNLYQVLTYEYPQLNHDVIVGIFQGISNL